jgi:4-hydroxy-3-methylbut-2-en-1-yl diphosphate synthase IspG/GcpE
MLKEDYYNTGKVFWKKHETFEFRSTSDLLNWVNDDKLNHHLSKKVFEAVMDCIDNDIDGMVVATISVMGLESDGILIQIQRKNFTKIVNGYIKRLIQNEDYEILSEIKPLLEKYGFEISE